MKLTSAARTDPEPFNETTWWKDQDLIAFVKKQFEKRLENYKSIPYDVRDHHETELEALAGGYSYRQVLELVQNAADAILEDASSSAKPPAGRILLQLNGNRLYAANTGAPLSREGIIALLSARSSSKRQNQIGRFGIGFKSLLGLEGPIDVFSRSVCLRFDPDKCGKTIRERLALSSDHPAPGLRLTWPIDPEAEFRLDPILNQLANWATTIVRVEITREQLITHVTKELRKFPGEFLLFLPVDVELELLAEPDLRRKITRIRRAKKVKLIENGEEAPWQVVEMGVPLSDPEARADATTVHTRDEVPIAWALPLSAREERGQFWAFFATDTPSRIPGILNAPWKVNSDRTALIHGPYNTFLMENAAKLIVSALGPLATPKDPARPLDMFPRDLETREETARPLVDAVWEQLRAISVVADGNGELRGPHSLALHPVDDEDIVLQWAQAAAPDLRGKFVHSTCYRGQRLSRLKTLLRRGKKEGRIEENKLEILLNSWIALIATPDIEKAKGVLRLAKRIHDDIRDNSSRDQLRRARIIPSAQGHLIAAIDFIIANGAVVPHGKFAVHPAIATDKECRQILEQVLGVRPLDESQWRKLLDQALHAANQYVLNAEPWLKLWSLLRSCPRSVALEFISSSSGRMRVRDAGGHWKTPSQVLRPGAIVGNHADFASVLLDSQYHADDESLLELLNIQCEPQNHLITWSSDVGSAYQQYLQVLRPYYSSLQRGNPQWGYLDFFTSNKVLAGVPLLCQLPAQARLKLTELLLLRLGNQSIQLGSFGHITRSDYYEPINVPSPTCWLLAHYGVVELKSVAVALRDLLTARETPWIRQLPGWNAILEKLDDLVSGFGEWQPPSGNLGSFWPAAFFSCASSEVSAFLRRICYEAAAAHGQVPLHVRIGNQLLGIDHCYVTSSDTLASQAEKAGVPVIVLSSDAIAAWTVHGAKNLASVARIEHDSITTDPLSLLDVAPEIAPVMPEESRDKAWVQACENLRIKIGEIKTALPATFEGGKFLVDLEQLGARPWQDRLTILVQEAINAGWITGDPDRIARDIVQKNFVRRRAEVASQATLEQRLLAAVGGTHIPFLATFDDAVRRAVELKHAMDPLEVARLALAVHGPTVLTALEEPLAKEGLEPPGRWGTQESFEFAVSLGFPPEFGGSRTARRSAELWTSGPMPLGTLHDYQNRLIAQLERLLARHKTEPARAVLSLPTGSGKTRVAVETAVKCVLQHDASLLWIAQTEELCEQAVQSFRQVWANRGKPWRDLRIIRLWGGNPNPVASDEGVPTVIVASIQTVASRIMGALPDWIRNASLVVIDEAHHAIASSYTRLLTWLMGKDADSRRKTPPPLLGLSATPFRGRDEEESHRLARRFDGRLYPAPEEQAELYQKLQAEGVLSEILIEPLNYAQPFVLTEFEKQQIKTFDEFPDVAAKRMGEDARRNDIIVQAVSNYAANGQVLLFANSVWHASHLAALLQLKGVRSAAVHGGTDTSARQYFIREFKKSSIRVLCNYGVLTTGFDAPKTDVIVISRPVFSPVRYMQMVGRGLRGEKNGGTATCRVVTVLDNIVEYSNRLAYHSYFTPFYQQ